MQNHSYIISKLKKADSGRSYCLPTVINLPSCIWHYILLTVSNCRVMLKQIIRGAVAILLILFGLGQSANAQIKDSTVIISSTDRQNTGPLILSGKTFYDILNPEKQGFRPIIFYSGDDRIFVGVNYNKRSGKYVPDSSGSKHQLYTHYSIEQKAFAVGYQGIVHRFAGQWNLLVDASYDWVRWLNFSGLGNESTSPEGNNNFYRIRHSAFSVNTAFHHQVGKQSSIIFTPFIQRLKLLDDEDRYLANAAFNDKPLRNYEPKYFGGIRGDLVLKRLDDQLVPTKGVIFSTGIAHVRNLSQPKAFTNYDVYTRFYLPFLNHFVFSVENGAATLSGDPEFYQLNRIGGSSLRGFRSDRFWGETVFHNNNELQYIFNVSEGVFQGKLGLLAFVDQGRVWKKGEQSNTWHRGYGGGLIIVPYNKVYFAFQYGISNERKGIHVEFRRSL
jgi:hypothetical protein